MRMHIICIKGTLMGHYGYHEDGQERFWVEDLENLNDLNRKDAYAVLDSIMLDLDDREVNSDKLMAVLAKIRAAYDEDWEGDKPEEPEMHDNNTDHHVHCRYTLRNLKVTLPKDLTGSDSEIPVEIGEMTLEVRIGTTADLATALKDITQEVLKDIRK